MRCWLIATTGHGWLPSAPGAGRDGARGASSELTGEVVGIDVPIEVMATLLDALEGSHPVP
jgi:hypothetical protein